MTVSVCLVSLAPSGITVTVSVVSVVVLTPDFSCVVEVVSVEVFDVGLATQPEPAIAIRIKVVLVRDMPRELQQQTRPEAPRHDHALKASSRTCKPCVAACMVCADCGCRSKERGFDTRWLWHDLCERSGHDRNPHQPPRNAETAQRRPR